MRQFLVIKCPTKLEVYESIPHACHASASMRLAILTISTRQPGRMSKKIWPAVGTVGSKQMLFVTLMDRAKRFEAHSSQFFANFD